MYDIAMKYKHILNVIISFIIAIIFAWIADKITNEYSFINYFIYTIGLFILCWTFLEAYDKDKEKSD